MSPEFRRTLHQTLDMLLADGKFEGTALYFDTLQDSVNDGQTYRENILAG